MQVPEWLAALAFGEVVAFLAFAGVVAGLVWRGTKGVRRLFRAIEDLAEDWAGRPARPGVEAQPGVMERLKAAEEAAQAAAAAAELTAYNTAPNGGSSPHDQLMQKLCDNGKRIELLENTTRFLLGQLELNHPGSVTRYRRHQGDNEPDTSSDEGE